MSGVRQKATKWQYHEKASRRGISENNGSWRRKCKQRKQWHGGSIMRMAAMA